MAEHYVDAARFAALFRSDWVANRDLIAGQIALISLNCTRNFARGGVRPEDLEDAAADATMIALRKLHRFNHRRYGANPFSYFSTVILRAIARTLRKQHARRVREMPLPAEL